MSKKLAIAVALALTFGSVSAQAAVEIIGSSTGERSGAPSSIPHNAVILDAKGMAQSNRETRVLSCAQFYGAAAPGVTYSGGPRYESRGNDNEPWTHDSGDCLRNYTENRVQETCPANQRGEVSATRQYSVDDNNQIVAGSDTGWVETNRTCDYFLTANQTRTRNATCPANMTGGIIELQSYESWSDGSERNVSDWAEVDNTCDYYKLNDDSEDRTVTCPPNQRGEIVQRQTFENWSDGTMRSVSPWNEVVNTCAYYFVDTGTETQNVTCPTGQTGTHSQRRSFENWSDGTKRNYGAWTTTSNTCKAAETECFPIIPSYQGFYSTHQKCALVQDSTYDWNGRFTYTHYVIIDGVHKSIPYTFTSNAFRAIPRGTPVQGHPGYKWGSVMKWYSGGEGSEWDVYIYSIIGPF